MYIFTSSPSAHFLLSLALPSHFKNNVSNSFLYQQFFSRLVIHGTKMSSYNYLLCTNYVFDTDKQAEMGMNEGQTSQTR